MTAKFWTQEIHKFTNLNNGVLTLKALSEGREDLNILIIKFRDGQCCALMIAGQEDSREKYNVYDGACTNARLTEEALEWEETIHRKFIPNDPKTGGYLYDDEFMGTCTNKIVRHLDDIVGIELRSYFEMNFITSSK